MKLTVRGETLEVSEIEQLRASNSEEFRTAVLSSLTDLLSQIDIDLSNTAVVDSSGLGALITLEKAAKCRLRREISVRLLNPTPSVQQILELTRVYSVLEIVKNGLRVEG